MFKSHPGESYSTMMSDSLAFDNSIFAWVLTFFILAFAFSFSPKSSPWTYSNSSMHRFMITLSKSWPPRCGSPAWAKTLISSPWIVRTVTSKVPPPRSKTRHFLSVFDLNLNPYASAAAVGSVITLIHSRPAIAHASLVACFSTSLKYAGTVTTHFLTSCPVNRSAASFIFSRIIALNCWQLKSRATLSAVVTCTFTILSRPLIVVKGQS